MNASQPDTTLIVRDAIERLFERAQKANLSPAEYLLKLIHDPKTSEQQASTAMKLLNFLVEIEGKTAQPETASQQPTAPDLFEPILKAIDDAFQINYDGCHGNSVRDTLCAKLKYLVQDMRRLTTPVNQPTLIRLDPQPNIQGSYIQDGPHWHYCEKPDIDRLTGPAPVWKTLSCPIGDKADLVQVKNIWYWRAQAHKGVRFCSSVSGLWYDNPASAGSICAIQVDGQLFTRTGKACEEDKTPKP